MALDYSHISQNLQNREYQLIGSGSGRRVFDLGDGKVVKVAKNRKGIAQNEAEYQIASSDDSKLFAKIYSKSKDSDMLIMEKADKVNYISDVWKYFSVRNNYELLQLKELRDIVVKHNLQSADLCRATSWGFVGSKLVIIDYGFTKEVRSKYYSRFGFF